MIRHVCPCGRTTELPDQLAGRTMYCGNCGRAFVPPAMMPPLPGTPVALAPAAGYRPSHGPGIVIWLMLLAILALLAVGQNGRGGREYIVAVGVLVVAVLILLAGLRGAALAASLLCVGLAAYVLSVAWPLREILRQPHIHLSWRFWLNLAAMPATMAMLVLLHVRLRLGLGRARRWLLLLAAGGLAAVMLSTCGSMMWEAFSKQLSHRSWGRTQAGYAMLNVALLLIGAVVAAIDCLGRRGAVAAARAALILIYLAVMIGMAAGVNTMLRYVHGSGQLAAFTAQLLIHLAQYLMVCAPAVQCLTALALPRVLRQPPAGRS